MSHPVSFSRKLSFPLDSLIDNFFPVWLSDCVPLFVPVFLVLVIPLCSGLAIMVLLRFSRSLNVCFPISVELISLLPLESLSQSELGLDCRVRMSSYIFELGQCFFRTS